MLKSRIAASLGSALEWYDFALYGYFGVAFSKNFFPSGLHSWVALIATYAIFAVGFAARPLGAIIFGYLGDKYGRAFVLRLIPALICLPTVGIALLPTYQQIGDLAVLLLCITRILQGIFLGGEFGGNIVYLCESTKKWKYFWGSIGSCTGSLGIILASLVASLFFTLFNTEFVINFGWRLAFLLAVPFAIITIWMRLRMQESLDYQAAVDKSDKIGNPIKFAYKHHKITLLICLGLICNHAISFYFVFMFLPVFLAKVRMMPESAALVNNTWFLLIHLIFIPILGYFVSFINGKNNIRISCLLFLALTFPLCSLLAFAEQKYILLGLLIFSILTALNAAVVPGLLAEITPARVRYTIVSFTFNLGFGVLGGVTPFLSLLLLHDFGNIFAAATYLAIGALITLFASFFLKANGREVATRYETREISGVR